MLCIFLPAWSLQNLAFWRSEWWHKVSLCKTSKTSYHQWFYWSRLWLKCHAWRMHDWTLLPESLEELRLTFTANKSSLEKRPGASVGCLAHGSCSREGRRLLSWKMARRNIKTWQEPQGLEKIGIAGIAHGRNEEFTKVQSKVSLCEFQQSRLKDLM